ncbi:MAG: hypothetical protein ACJAUQ_001673, partial [Maribacter sp.]
CRFSYATLLICNSNYLAHKRYKLGSKNTIIYSANERILLTLGE